MDDTTEAEDAEDDICLPGDIAECRGNEVGEGEVEDLSIGKSEVSRVLWGILRVSRN